MNGWIEPATCAALFFAFQHLQWFWLRRGRRDPVTAAKTYENPRQRRLAAIVLGLSLGLTIAALLIYFLAPSWMVLALFLLAISSFWPTVLHLLVFRQVN